MISPSFDNRKFIEAIQDEEYPEIIRLAQQEAIEADGLSFGQKPEVKDKPMEAQAWENRKWACQQYREFIGAFVFFIRSRIKPDGIDDSDFQLFRPVCENLVQKGQCRPEVMDYFKQD